MADSSWFKKPGDSTIYYFKDAQAREDISSLGTGKADKSAVVSNVSYDQTNKKITKTINGTTSDVVTAATLKTAMSLSKSDVGLSNVENKSSATIRGELTSSNVTTALGYTPVNPSSKGVANGVAELDSTGKVPSSQLPSYVDDVLEYASKNAFPATGESGKIYVDTTTNLTYRWSGTAYVEISQSLALGTTSSTAFRGDYGNSAYIHAVTNKGSAFASGMYKIATNAEGHVTAATAVTKSDITGLGIPSKNTTYTSKAAASGGTDVSLVTTGEKYNWNNKTSLTLGTTSSTAYRGDYGNTAYTHATDGSRLTTAKASGFYKIATTSQGHVASVSAVEKSDITALGIPAQDTTYENKAAVNGGASVSLVTTGEKYTWNNKLSTHQTIKQDGVTGAIANHYGVCSTAAGAPAKTVSITAGTFSLEAGSRVSVLFTNANTADSPTLNVNSTGAKNIYHKFVQITTDTNKELLAGVCDFVYDGDEWNFVGNYINTGGSGDDTKVTQNASITTSGAYPIILGYSTATTAVTNTVNKSASFTYNPNTKALSTGGTVDGYTLAAASAKGVDTSISTLSSTNLPTTAAVAAYAVSDVTYDTTNKRLKKTINGTASDVVTVATLKTDMSLNNVENKSSATIRGELTSSNVTTALGYTPLDSASVITDEQIDALFA